jgi:septum formation protein
VRPLILASTSPYRRALLERLGLPFEVARPQVDEFARPGEPPATRASRLSAAKADAVAARFPKAVVIGSDQVAALGDQILDKPGDAETCRSHLRALSGRTAHFFTAWTLIDQASPRTRECSLDTTLVSFRVLTDDEIERYVAREKPFDCAGGFKAEALGVSLFECIESRDPTALIGLPLISLTKALRRAGYRVP